MLLCKVIEKEPVIYRADSDMLKESSRSHNISRAAPLKYNSSAMNTERICADSLSSKLQLNQVPIEEDETHDSPRG